MRWLEREERRRQAEECEKATQPTRRLKAIQKKKDRLVEAHVHEQTIDAKTFREHMDRLREQEAIARMERYGAELEDLEVGAVLAFAERTLCDLAGSWNREELQQKQRLQSIIFPSGVTWDGEAVGTRETARVFGWIDPISVSIPPWSIREMRACPVGLSCSGALGGVLALVASNSAVRMNSTG